MFKSISQTKPLLGYLKGDEKLGIQ